jgi:prolyl-tRNA editing enzyme YbaK/EbsC (Cys-tRNA(Pro) deacylase)
MEGPQVHPKVREALGRWQIEHEVIPCDAKYADTADFCATYGYPLHTSGNSILVASTRGPKCYALGVVRATHRLDVNHTMRRLMGVPRASFAKAEETMDVTGMAIGGVTPFGLPDDLTIYLDEGLRDLEYVILGAGTRWAKIKVHPHQLEKIPNARFQPDLAQEVEATSGP